MGLLRNRRSTGNAGPHSVADLLGVPAAAAGPDVAAGAPPTVAPVAVPPAPGPPPTPGAGEASTLLLLL